MCRAGGAVSVRPLPKYMQVLYFTIQRRPSKTHLGPEGSASSQFVTPRLAPFFTGTKPRTRGREAVAGGHAGGRLPRSRLQPSPRPLYVHSFAGLTRQGPSPAPGTKGTDEPVGLHLPRTHSLTLGVQTVVLRVPGHLPTVPTDTRDSLPGIRPGHPSL